MKSTYPTCTASGISWLGSIPSHWTVKRLKHACTIQTGIAKGKPVSKNLIRVPMLRVANVQDDWLDLHDVHEMDLDRDQLNRYLLQEGDVLMNEGGDRDKLGRGTIWRGEIPGCIHQNHVFAIRPQSISPEWLDVLTRASYAKYYFLQVAKQSTNLASISSSNIKETPLLVPPPEEQAQIAKFLDYETAKIDALIEKQQQLIALLKEKRQAVISHAVTKGLDPNVPMRDSGVEWLGDVPEHWKVLSTSRVSDLTTGSRDTQDAKLDGEFPFFVRSETIEKIDTFSFEGEAVLTSGDGAGVGKIFHHHIGKLEFHQRVYLFCNFREITSRFFFYFLREHLAIVALAGNAKSTVDSLRRPMLRTFPVCVPPIQEQIGIAEFLDKTVNRIDELISRQDEFESLLQEKRTALISAAVTGKIDVRGWTPPESSKADVS